MKRSSKPETQAGVLLLVLALTAGWFGCGRMPPEPIWEPSAEDSAAILAWVEDNRAMFSAAFDDAAMRACDTVMPGTTRTRLLNEISENPFRQRIRHDGLQFVFHEDGRVFRPSFIAVVDTTFEVAAGETTRFYDTTATVTVVESIPGELRIRAFSYTKYLRDTLFEPSPGESLWLQLFAQEFTPVDTAVIDPIVVKRFEGTSGDGAVLRKQDGAWRPWRYAGGSRFFAPSQGDAPYVLYMNLMGKDTTVRLFLRPDTQNFGMQRLYSADELPTFRVGDSLTIRQGGVLTWVGDAAGYIYFRGERYEFQSPRSVPVPLTEPGIFTLFATQTPIEILYEIDGERLELRPEYSGQYIGTVWGIRIRVVED